MTPDEARLRALYATLLTIGYLVTVAAVLAYFGKYTEAVGVGAAITGLFGLSRGMSTGPAIAGSTQTGDVTVTPAQKDPS